MKITSTVTIIPKDSVIIVDGVSKKLDFRVDPGIHAIQWSGDSGRIEYEDPRTASKVIKQEDFAKVVAPYVALWEQTIESPSMVLPDNATIIRSYRNDLLSSTDFYLLPDYRDNLTDDQYKQLLDYRENLRKIPEHPEFPWNGNSDQVAWPVAPTFIKSLG